MMRRELTAAAAVVLCGISWGGAPAPGAGGTARQWYEKANALFVAQKFPECSAALEEALRRDPKLVPALTLKAKLAMAMNRYDVARATLEQAIAADPKSSYAWFLYGFQFHEQNELRLALPALQKARSLNPKDPRAAVYLGLTVESLGRNAEALALYREAISLEEAQGGAQADTLVVYSRLLLLTGNYEECGKVLSRAASIAPASRDVHYERARLLLKQGDAAAAAAEGEKALRLPAIGTTDVQIHYLLVRAYRATGQEELAAAHTAALREAEAKRSFNPMRPR